MNSIQWLKHIQKKNKSRQFIIDERTGEELTFRNLHQLSCNTAEGLANLNFKKGERISVLLNNSIDCVKFYFACLYSGIVVVPIPLTSSNHEIHQIIIQSKSKAIIVDNESIDKINPSILRRKKIKILTLDQKLKNKKQITVINQKFLKNSFVPFRGVSSKDDLIIIFTSGTTSVPKAVVHSIENLVDNGRAFGKKVGINHKNRFVNILSLMYLGGYYNLLLLPYVCGSSIILSSNFEPTSIINFWSPILKFKVNSLWLVPSIMSILLEMDRGNQGSKYSKKNIILTCCGTAPLNPLLKSAFQKKYGVNVLENYGLTETFFISTNSKALKSGVGKILPDIQLRIINEEDQTMPNGKEGEIIVKSPYLMKGYFDYNTNKTLLQKSSWFRTGDIGKISKNELFITGRKKDLIIRGGINISPSSIENVITKHPKVTECAIIGIPNKILGEEIIAVVQLDSNTKLKNIESNLRKICKKNLGIIKQPSKFIQLPILPRSTYGKIQKNKIRAWLKTHFSTHTQSTLKIQKKNYVNPTKNPKFVISKSVSKSVQALSIKYNNLVYEKQAKGEDITVLSLGEAFFDIPLFSFDDLPKSKIFHYSHSRGIPGLRKKISKYFLDNYDVVIDASKEIIITAGSKIGIQMSLMTCLNPGDEVIIHEPTWVSFPEQVKYCHSVPVQVPYYETIFDFEKYISKKTRMIIINSPHNPTGKIYSLEELSFLYSLAKKHNLTILSDEVYSDFLPDEDEFISLANLDIEKQNSIIVNSISKNFGISGWRIGYVIGNPRFIDQLLKLNQHLITCPPTILEYYLENHFEDIVTITKPQIRNLIRKRNETARYMDKISLSYLPGRATFYFFVSISDSKLNSNDFCTQLLDHYHISTVPGIGYGKSCDKFIRVSVGSENIQRIKHAIKVIKKLIIQTSK